MLSHMDYHLVCLSEECAELIKAVTKAQRFGLESFNPVDGKYNRAALHDKCSNVVALIELLVHTGVIPELTRHDLMTKQDKVENCYREYEEGGPDCGRI